MESILYGKKESLPLKTRLTAGALSLVYENGFVRYVRAGGFEVLRMINHAVRDHNWGTVPLYMLDEKIEKQEAAFRIHYRCEARQGDIRFLWRCKIEGKADSSLSFLIEGEALTPFRRNRAGFTVLHPVSESVGKKVLLTHPDGTTERKAFPEAISPHQPFLNIRAMEWGLGPAGKARLEFSGDVFETEDQRNWLDDSFKTYCTPLERPFPVQLRKGDTIRQAISLRVEGFTPTAGPSDPAPLTFAVGEQAIALPKMGIGQSSEGSPLPEAAGRLLKRVPFDHYQVDLKLYEKGWKERWARAELEATRLGLPLELSLFLDDVDLEFPAFSAAVGRGAPGIAYVSVFDKTAPATRQATLEAVVPALRALFPGAGVGAGTNAFFTQLNRHPTPAGLLDYVVYSVNPQVHATDNGTVVENLNALPYTVRTAKRLGAGKAVHISPVSFRMRWNPDAAAEKQPVTDRLPDDVDPRQMSLFGAAWVLGAVGQLLVAGVEAVSFFETIGLKGIMQSASPKFTDQFHAPANAVYPMYFVFKLILENKYGSFFPLTASHPLTFTGLAFGDKGEAASNLLLANFTGDHIKVKLPPEFAGSDALVLDAGNALSLMKDPESFDRLKGIRFRNSADLPPFGIGWLKRST